MNKLTSGDLSFVVRRIPRDVRKVLESGSFFVAGGFIRETIAGNAPKDIDIFGETKGQLLDCANAFAAARCVNSHVTDNAITVLVPPRLPVQFITRWVFGSPELLIASFDFTVCQAAVWFDKETKSYQSIISDGFYSDLAARRLVYACPKRDEEVGGSMMRVCKFLSRGWNIQAPSLGAIVARLAGGIVSFERLSEDERAKILTGLLFEVDPLLVIDGLEPINEHEAQ